MTRDVDKIDPPQPASAIYFLVFLSPNVLLPELFWHTAFPSYILVRLSILLSSCIFLAFFPSHTVNLLVSLLLNTQSSLPQCTVRLIIFLSFFMFFFLTLIMISVFLTVVQLSFLLYTRFPHFHCQSYLCMCSLLWMLFRLLSFAFSFSLNRHFCHRQCFTVLILFR